MRLVTALLGLLLLNFVAHFLPPERAGFQPDDDFRAAFSRGLRLSHGTNDLVSIDRPLTRAAVLAAGRALGRATGTRVQVVAVFAVSSLLLIAAFLFLADLLQDRALALAGAAIYCLLPNRLELHGTLMYAILGTFLALYASSAWALLRYLRTERVHWLALALVLYTLALAGYELGFLMPVAVVVLAAPPWSRVRRILAWFALPAVGLGGLRLATMLGALPDMETRPINWTAIGPNAVSAVPNLYLGRHMARAVAYGLLGFGEMSLPWLWLAIILDALLVGWLLAYWRRVGELRSPAPPLGRALLAAVLLLAPAVLVPIQARHTALASVAVCAWLVGPAARLARQAAAVLFVILLMASQGDAWHNVVAGRINRAMFETLARRAGEIRAAERVVVDVDSFARGIPYTLGERERNVLHYYWGVAVLGSWGLEAMVALAAEQSKPVLSCASPPLRSADTLSCLEHFTPPGPVALRSVPLAGTLLLTFADVYPRGFDPSSGRP